MYADLVILKAKQVLVNKVLHTFFRVWKIEIQLKAYYLFCYFDKETNVTHIILVTAEKSEINVIISIV